MTKKRKYIFLYINPIFDTINLTIVSDRDFKELVEVVKKLDKYAVKIRYPYFYTPTLEKAKESYEMAIKVKECVLKKVKLND